MYNYMYTLWLYIYNYNIDIDISAINECEYLVIGTQTNY